MANISNPRKAFKFIVEVNGLNQFEVQKVTLPETEIEEVKHGDANRDVKTPGRVMVGDMVFEKLRPLPGSDLWAWEWFNACQNMQTGGGELPINVWQMIIIKEMDNTGLITANSWVCEEVWPKKISATELDRNASENLIETITFSVGRVARA